MKNKVLFSVLSRDLENAKEISRLASDRMLIGLMVKNYANNDDVILDAKRYMQDDILVSIGLGAGDPFQWKRVVEVAVAIKPYHINQIFTAAGYTLGKVQEVNKDKFIVNALIEPGNTVGKVYIATGPKSKAYREEVTCEMAACMISEIGISSVKFFPIDGNKKIEHVKAMVKSCVKEGITIFEPTGGIDIENVHEIVEVCLSSGADMVIPHLYTSLIDKDTGKTKVEYVEKLLNMNW